MACVIQIHGDKKRLSHPLPLLGLMTSKTFGLTACARVVVLGIAVRRLGNQMQPEFILVFIGR